MIFKIDVYYVKLKFKIDTLNCIRQIIYTLIKL